MVGLGRIVKLGEQPKKTWCAVCVRARRAIVVCIRVHMECFISSLVIWFMFILALTPMHPTEAEQGRKHGAWYVRTRICAQFLLRVV